MKLTANSRKLISCLIKYDKIQDDDLNSKTSRIFTELHNDLLDAYNFTITKGMDIYTIKTRRIVSPSSVSLPKNKILNTFPREIRQDISNMVFELLYEFSLGDRKIKIIFVLKEPDVIVEADIYNKYVRAMTMWLYIINKYSSPLCAKDLIIYMYFTTLEKKLPEREIIILNENNVNTAFTTTCPVYSEIVIFRKEEWFKVFIHETFHNFGIDFSDMNNTECTKSILNLFKVNSIVNLFEAYTEFWAEIINILFASFFSIGEKTNTNDLLENMVDMINVERTHSLFQMVKTLNFMGLKYNDLYMNKKTHQERRDRLYKENANILSYYIIKTILLENYQSFLSWCNKHNNHIFSFTKTKETQEEFCKFIEKNYKSKHLSERIHDMEVFNKQLHAKRECKSIEYMLTNMRMSIIELG